MARTVCSGISIYFLSAKLQVLVFSQTETDLGKTEQSPCYKRFFPQMVTGITIYCFVSNVQNIKVSSLSWISYRSLEISRCLKTQKGEIMWNSYFSYSYINFKSFVWYECICLLDMCRIIIYVYFIVVYCTFHLIDRSTEKFQGGVDTCYVEYWWYAGR